MADASTFRRVALSLPDVSEAPHFERAAFRRARIFATLAGDGQTANIRFSPDEQEFKVMLAPEAFQSLDNAWGKQGWTVATLAELTEDELRAALEVAWAGAAPKLRKSRVR